MITLNTASFFELGEYISDKLIKGGVTDASNLSINIDNETFKKIDEDVFYTFKKNGIYDEDVEFIPSEKEIILSFPRLSIILNKKKEE